MIPAVVTTASASPHPASRHLASDQGKERFFIALPAFLLCLNVNRTALCDTMVADPEPSLMPSLPRLGHCNECPFSVAINEHQDLSVNPG